MVRLWRVVGEWGEWQALTGDAMSRAEYEAALADAAAEAAGAGQSVELVEMSAAEMREALRRAGLPNNTANRAVVIAGDGEAPREARTVMALKLTGPVGSGQQAIGWAIVREPGLVVERRVEPVGDDGVRGAVRRLLAGWR